MHILDETDIFLSSGDQKIDEESDERLLKFKRILKELDKAFTNQTSKNLPLFRIVLLLDFF